MKDFFIADLRNNNVAYLDSIKAEIQMDPLYQRQGDIWDLEKRQLLIDSLINGFDLPKIYLHDLTPGKKIDDRRYLYAIIDGKQRLGAIWDFLSGGFPLANQFQYFEDEELDLSGLTYPELVQEHPRVASLLTSTSLPIVTIRVADLELIEEMFSRLNEAVPLNAAEKRNAFGGPLPILIRSISTLPFFTSRLPFPNTRYRHFDLAVKFLYFEYNNGPVDTKKGYLDLFVRNHKNEPPGQLDGLETAVRRRLARLQKVFTPADPLLGSIGMTALYYLVAMRAEEQGWPDKFSRRGLDRFDERRRENRSVAETDIGRAKYDLLEFDRLSQSPNDGTALEYRLKVITEYLRRQR